MSQYGIDLFEYTDETSVSINRFSQEGFFTSTKQGRIQNGVWVLISFSWEVLDKFDKFGLMYLP